MERGCFNFSLCQKKKKKEKEGESTWMKFKHTLGVFRTKQFYQIPE